jgi:methylphosphotriester-DNA--protein-cysteine methyltransferase
MGICIMNILHKHTGNNASDQPDSRWQAVLGRDKEFDGEFVYAVKTTGVYCRASCPSRVAKRGNVAFFDTTIEAQAAGFRACKRCNPDGVSLEHARNAAVNAACDFLKATSGNVALTTLAERASMSAHHFHRVFKSITGVTPKAYQKTLQQSRITEALGKNKTVTDAIYDAGFNSSGRFYENAEAILGMTPGIVCIDCGPVFRSPVFSPPIKFSRHGWEKFWNTLITPARNRAACWICRSIFKAPYFSRECGKQYARFQRVPH